MRKARLFSTLLLSAFIAINANAEDSEDRGFLSELLISDQLADSTGLDIRGWISTGVTLNTTSSSNFNGPVTFNDRADKLQLDQLYLILEKKITSESSEFGLGGRVDVMYGADAQFSQSVGFDDNLNGNNSPINQLAIPQAYLEANLPIGSGVTLKAGHFYTLLGYEVVTAPDNFFYSHSYSMQYDEPFTHWGALASYAISDKLTATLGAVRGWDNLSDDADGNLTTLGGLTYQASDDTTLVFSLISGNQGHNQNLTGYSLVATHIFDDKWSYVLQHDFTNYDAADGTKSWYGLVNYLFYELTEDSKLGVRFDWFNDADGFRVAGLRSASNASESNYYSVSLGLNTALYSNLIFRPEVRYDWQDGPVEQSAFADGNDRSQLLVAGNLILKF